MELTDCIIGRRAIRSYQDKQVKKEMADAILDAGIWAPSGVNEQPWNFIIIEDAKTIKRLSSKVKEILLEYEWSMQYKAALESEMDTIFYGAPLLVIICVEKDEEWHTIRSIDCGLASQNMMLKAYDLGLGSCFIGFGNYLNEDADTKQSIGVPEGHQILSCMIFGHPGEEPEAKERELKLINWIK